MSTLPQIAGVSRYFPFRATSRRQPPNQRKSPATCFIVIEIVSNKQSYGHYCVVFDYASWKQNTCKHTFYI